MNNDPPAFDAEVLAGLQLSPTRVTADSRDPDYEAAIPVSGSPSSSLDDVKTVNRHRLDSLNRGGASPGSSFPDLSDKSEVFLNQKLNAGYINAQDLNDVSPNESPKQHVTRNPIPTPRDSHA